MPSPVALIYTYHVFFNTLSQALSSHNYSLCFTLPSECKPQKRTVYYILFSSQTHVLLEVHDSDHLLVPRKTTLANGITNVVSHCEVLTKTRLDSATKNVETFFPDTAAEFLHLPWKIDLSSSLRTSEKPELRPKSSHTSGLPNTRNDAH